MGTTSRDAFIHVLAHLREPVLLVSRNATIVAGNVAAANALDISVEDLAGAPFASVCAESPDLALQLLESAPNDASFPLRTRDGRRFSCDASLLAPDLFFVRLSGGPDAEKRARSFFDMFSRLEGFSSERARSMTELASTLLSFGMSSVGARAGGLFLLDANGLTLELAASVGYREESVARFRLVTMAARIPLTDSVREATPLFFERPADFLSTYPQFAAANPAIVENAMACVPMIVDDRCIGTIGLGFLTPWTFTEADRAFLRDFARQCAQTLLEVRTKQASQDSALATSRFERLHAYTGALAQATTPAEVTEAALDASMAATGARSGGLWLLSDCGLSTTLARSVGPTGPRPEHFKNVPLDRAPAMPVFDSLRMRTPIWIESCRQLELRYPEAFKMFSKGGESSLACVPLIAQGRCIGTISYNFDHEHRFLEDERAFFHLLTWYAAQALERARAYAAEKLARGLAEAAQRRSEFLSESSVFLSSLDYRETLHAAAAAIVPRMADWCVIELQEERARNDAPIVAHADPAKTPIVAEIVQRSRDLGDHPLSLVHVFRSPQHRLHRKVSVDELGEMHPDPELITKLRTVALVSSMTVPISARGTTFGAVVFNSSSPDRLYDELDLTMASEFGRKLGLALENARLYRNLREGDRLKDEFLAMLSHELRNPLVPIVAAVDLLGLHDDDAYAQERALIQRNVRHLVRLVDDLLDVSRITRGKVLLQREPSELSELVAEAVDIAYPLIEARGHRLTLAVPRNLLVFTDRVRITQAIANLMTNSAKYTDVGGSISVVARIEGAEVALSVADTGIGISPELLPRVFEMFVQASRSMDRSQGGLGIGLTIVKSIVELHGGTITAHSAGLGTGTDMVLRLPLEQEEPPEAPGTFESDRVYAGKRVLVVDDNHDAAAVISELMMAVGFNARVAHNGPTALAIAREFKPDLALLDLGLPRMDGYELARHLRLMFPDLRIVAVSGYEESTDRSRSAEAGFDEHVVKPVDLDTLRQVVADLDE